MRLQRPVSLLLCGTLVLGLAGCATPRAGGPQAAPSAVSPALARAEALFTGGRYSDAIVAVSEIARKDPLTPGLPELQATIMRSLAEARQKSHTSRERNTEPRMLDDVLARSVLPETYELKRNVRGETAPLRSAPSKMQAALSKNVTVHLDNVDLAAFAAQIAASEGINIIADSNLAGATMTVHAEDTPLLEILEYVGRNLGVTFSVGSNLIWATPNQDPKGTLPLETRVYRLRKGLAGDEMVRPQSGQSGSSGGSGGRSGGRSGSGGFGGTVPPGAGGAGAKGDEGPSMIEVITRFVVQPDGADLFFSPKAHALVVKNTRENLVLTEDIIAAMDVTPPQIHIEARFISTLVGDMSELGIDWILDSPYVISQKAGIVDGQPAMLARTGIPATTPDNLLGFNDFKNSSQGLNFTFQGVLTDPAFRAVVHILEASDKSRTLSVPRITTINNRTATIRDGRDYRYYEEYDLEEYDTVQGTGNNATTVTRTQLVPVGTPTVEELGIELAVTPSVGADLSSINLALIPQISDFAGEEDVAASQAATTTTGSTNGLGATSIQLPIFRRSRIETEVVVRSGETVVMGGLIREQRSKSREGVPILSHIPFIGQLFRHDTTSTKRENLIIFVTATLISEVGEEMIPLEEMQAGENNLHGGVGAAPAPGVGTPAAPPPEATVAEPATEAPAPVAVEAPAP